MPPSHRPSKNGRIITHLIVLFVICGLLTIASSMQALPRWAYLAVVIGALFYFAYEFYFFFFILPKTSDSDDE